MVFLGGNYRWICLLFLFCGKGYGQKVMLDEKFDKAPGYYYQNAEANKMSTFYYIDPYLPKERFAFDLYSDDPNQSVYFTDSRCCGSDDKHGFYTSIDLYHRDVPSDRLILVIKLDSVLPAGKSYEISLEALYHQFTEYHIDSLQALFLSEEKDIQNWLADRNFTGLQIGISLRDVDNRNWKKIDAEFKTGINYRFLLIGNLKRDEECTVTEANNCNCKPKPKKAGWHYSELLIDNILITGK
jgi:hypothetical protein